MQLTDKLTITNEDCMELLKRTPDKFYDLCIIDPPYGILNCKWDKIDDLELWINSIYSKLKDDGTLIVFGQQPMFSKVIYIMGDRFSHEIIWEKTQKGGFVNANRMPLRAHENIAVSKVTKSVFYNVDKVYTGEKYKKVGTNRKQEAGRYQGYSGVNNGGTYTNTGFRYPDSFMKFEADSIILESNWNNSGCFGNAGKNTFHPTQKPIGLYKRLLKLYGKPNALVLDCFFGSGSIAIACHDYGFDLTACELDKHYYDLAIKRIQGHIAQTKIVF